MQSSDALTVELERGSSSHLLLLPTTFSDDNSGNSLRSMIITANTNSNGLDTIELATGTYVLDKAGINEDSAATGDLDILEDLIIRGEGSGNTFIQMAILPEADRDRVFDVFGVEVTFEDLTIENGLVDTANGHGAGDGGGIRNTTGDVTLDGVTLRNNQAETGGGIAVLEGGTLVDGSSPTSITDNEAATAGGGAFVADGLVDLSDQTEVTSNQATGSGGGIWADDLTTVELDGTTIATNTAGSNGGGIYVGGTLDGIAPIVESNHAGLNGGGVYSGAGVASLTGGPTIENNEAEDLGGGIYSLEELAIGGGRVGNNTAGAGGGGVYVAGGTASIGGGAGLTLPGVLVAENEVLSGDGGGVYIAAGIVEIEESTIDDNEASSDGGGIWTGATLSLGASDVTANTAGSNGGGIFMSDEASLSSIVLSSISTMPAAM